MADGAKPPPSEMAVLNLGSITKIPLGQGACFVVGAEEIAVFRPRAGGLCAVQNRCPHRDAPLYEGVIDSTHVVCPYHGHKFDLHTGVGTQAGEKLKTYVVCEENGEIILKV